MKIPREIRRRAWRVLTSPGEELGSWARLVRFQVRLWYFCARRLRQNNALAMSSALSFRTIFAMVPAVVLAVVALKAFYSADEAHRFRRMWLERAGLTRISVLEDVPVPSVAPSAPAAGGSAPATAPAGAAPAPPHTVNLADKIDQTIARVEEQLTFGRIGPVGLVLLIWTATTLLTTVERCLNRIFGAPRSRGTAVRILLYWAAMTLGPIALVAADYLTALVVGLCRDVAGLNRVVAAIGWLQPVVVGAAILAAVYAWLPNTAVSARAALGGAAVAWPLWLLAKWGFGLYVAYLVAPGNVYGSLGLIPLFLLWLNLSWWLFLFGAEVAATAADLRRFAADFGESRRAEDAPPTLLGPWDALAAMVALARRYAAGKGPATAAEIAEDASLPPPAVGAVLERLLAAGAVCLAQACLPPAGGQAPAGSTAYVPARPPDKTPLADLLDLGLEGPGSAAGRLGPGPAQILQRALAQTRQALKDLTLADLLRC